MGSTQSVAQFNPDPSRRSKSVKLPTSKHSKIVIFGENTENQIAPLLEHLPLTQEQVGSSSLNLSLKVDYVPAQSGDLVLGISGGKKLNPTTTVIENNKNMYIWYMTKGKFQFRGRQQHRHSIPKVKKDGLVSVEFIMASGKVILTVSNPGEEPSSQELTLTHLPNMVVPFVGAVNTGNYSSSVSICESSITSHNNNSLRDLTYQISFDKTYGVISISPDKKSVMRKSTQQGNGCALLPIKMSSGVHHWTFVVKCDFGASMCLGLARYPFLLSEEYTRDHSKHIYRHPSLLLYRTYRGLLYKDGIQQDLALESLGWQQNTSVSLEFIFDCSKGTLEILKNGVSLGVAFDNLVGIFQPVIGYYASYEKEVEFKQYMTTEVSPDILQSPPSSLDSKLAVDEQEINMDTIGFDESHLHGALNITKDSKSLVRSKTDSGNCFCFLNISCSKLGSYRISFVVEFDQGASTCLGITDASHHSEVKLNDVGNVYTSKSLYLYRSFQGMLYIRGKEQSTRLEEYWMSGTLVEMEVIVASNESSVNFKVNGLDQGIAFSGLQAPLRPLVAFYAGMEKRVTIIHYEFVAVKSAVDVSFTTPAKILPESSTSILKPRGGIDSEHNDINTKLTHASKCPLPILCSSSDAVDYRSSCITCQASNDVICLPCKHSSVCSKHISLGPNARPHRCNICDQRVTQMWNIIKTVSLPLPIARK